MALPQYTMGQVGLLDFSPLLQAQQNALGRAMQQRKMDQETMLQNERLGMDRERLGFDRQRMEREAAMDPLRMKMLEAQLAQQNAETGMLPLKRNQLAAQIELIQAQARQAQQKDALDQIFMRQFGVGDQPQPQAPAQSPIRPQSFAPPTPERPAIMTPATAGMQPQEPAGDPMLIRTQAAPGQPQAPGQPRHDPMVQTPAGPMPASKARMLGFLLAYRGKGDAGKMIADPADPTKLPKEALNEIGKDEVKLTESLGRMREISRQFRPEFLTFEEQAKQYGVSWLDKFDATRSKLTPEQIQQHAQYTAFRRDTVDNLNRYIKEITGAAMGVEEAKRIISAQPNMDDGPTAFIAKIKATQRAAELAVARARLLRRDGFNGRPWDGNPETAAQVLPLERMKGIILEDSKRTYQQIRQQFPDGDEGQISGAVRAHIRSKYGMDI